MKKRTKDIILLTLLLSSFWIVMPMTNIDFTFTDLWFKRGLRTLLSIGLVVWVNIKYLLPHFYFNNKKGFYLISSILLIVMVTLTLEGIIDPFFELERPNRNQSPARPKKDFLDITHFIRGLIPFVLTIFGSTLAEVSNFANEKMQEALVLQGEKTEAELKMLKSQINPHFLFNALNNVYSLSYLKPEKTPENLLKLSKMLRYMLYECNDEFVPLQKEVEVLENFIALNLLKDSRGMKIKVAIEDPLPGLMIAPLLLIPFVENAFKHSKIEDLEKGWITIVMRTIEKRLIFRVENSIPEVRYTKDEVGGIGLTNVKRRLALLYPKKSKLDVQSEKEKFNVKLEIDLS